MTKDEYRAYSRRIATSKHDQDIVDINLDRAFRVKLKAGYIEAYDREVADLHHALAAAYQEVADKTSKIVALLKLKLDQK